MKKILFVLIAGMMGLAAIGRDVNIVFVGNSITRGATLADRETEAPPVKAVEYLRETVADDVRVNYKNCGVSGMTTLNYLPVSNQEFPHVVEAARELSQNGGELVFSISLGTNDSASTVAFGAPVAAEQYYTNMQAIINELLRLFPGCKVMIQCPLWYSPNTYNVAVYLGAGLKRLESYKPMIMKLIEYYADVNPGHVFLGDTEAFDFFKENYELFTPEDGNAGVFYLHPNMAGAATLGRYWGKALITVL